MKKVLFTLLIIAGALSITVIYSCKKNDSTTSNSNNPSGGSSLNANNQTFNDDANYYKSENDNANNDVNNDMSNYSSMQGRMAEGGSGGTFQSTYPHPCGCANPDTSQLHSNQKITYTFDNTTDCWGRHRAGTIVVQLTTGTHWSDSGAVLTFTYINYKVTRLYDNKSITFNGMKTLKNVNGSNWLDLLYFLAGTRTIKLQDRALGVNVTFNGGLTATWNTAYTTEWSHDTTGLKLYYYRASGDTSVGGYTNVYAWGVNRFGTNFYSHTGVGNPVICNSLCGYGEPMSGQVTHNVDSASLTINLGVNSNGTPYTGIGCPWGFNVVWQFPHSNGNANFQYW